MPAALVVGDALIQYIGIRIIIPDGMGAVCRVIPDGERISDGAHGKLRPGDDLRHGGLKKCLILGKRIRKVHFKDYRCNPGGLNCFVDLLSGDVNWPEVMKAFHDIGYEGWAAGEMIPQYTYASDQIVYNTSKSMDRILGGQF